MSVGNNAASAGSQAEYIRRELPLMTAIMSVLYKRFKVRTDVKPVSTRPARIPLQPLTQGGSRIGNFDGADMGLGTAPVETFGSLSCISLLQPSQYTLLSQWATDETSKAVKNFVALTHEQSPKVFAGFIDSLIAVSDGSNTLDSVVSTTTGGLVVNNANVFQDQQSIDAWTAVNGSFIATMTIQSVDIANNTIWLDGAVPGGVVAGVLLLAEGSSGQSNSGIAGLPAYNVAGNLGNFLGIPRSSFAGKFSTPNVNRGGKAMTAASMRVLFNQIFLALGPEQSNVDNLVFHGNVDSQAAWENIGLNQQTVIANQRSSSQMTDMLPKNAVTSIAGREFICNPRALPGRVDALALDSWWRIQTRNEDLVDIEGQTAFPTIGESGGINSSVVFYQAAIMNVGCSQPRMNGFYNNFAIPPGYFLH